MSVRQPIESSLGMHRPQSAVLGPLEPDFSKYLKQISPDGLIQQHILCLGCGAYAEFSLVSFMYTLLLDCSSWPHSMPRTYFIIQSYGTIVEQF